MGNKQNLMKQLHLTVCQLDTAKNDDEKARIILEYAEILSREPDLISIIQTEYEKFEKEVLFFHESLLRLYRRFGNKY